MGWETSRPRAGPHDRPTPQPGDWGPLAVCTRAERNPDCMWCHARLGRETTGCVPPPCPTETAGRRRGVAAAGPALAPAPRRPWWHGWPLPRPSGRHTRGRCRGRFRAEQWGTRLRGLGVGFLVRAVWAWVGPHAAAPRPARDAQAPPRATGQARLGSRRPRRWGGGPSRGGRRQGLRRAAPVAFVARGAAPRGRRRGRQGGELGAERQPPDAVGRLGPLTAVVLRGIATVSQAPEGEVFQIC